jgi:hypothetical protein
MKFLNFFNKKKQYSFENLLKKAADDASYRIEFLKRLLDEDLVLITNSKNVTEGTVRLEKDMKVNVFTFSDGRIPVFTSTDRIFDKGVIKEQVNYLRAKSQDIFGFLKGAKLILNPYSDYRKEFLPDEIERLLDGSYFTGKAREIVVEKETTVKIGQPARYPDLLVKALNRIFANDPSINSAYLGWIHDESSDVPPHYIFAISMNGDWKKLTDAIGSIVTEIIGDEIVDFMRITGRGGIENYFIENTKPFYVNASAN